MPLSELASYRFTVTEIEAGEPVIAFEPVNGALSVLSHFEGLLTLELKRGLTVHEARALVRLLNEKIEGHGARCKAPNRVNVHDLGH
jgi:hypothetical protein